MVLKRRLSFLLAAALAAVVLAPTARADAQDAPPDTLCEAYLVMDADTGQVLLEKTPTNACTRRPPPRS